MIASVDICICTYRRASLSDTLRSIAAQRLSAGVKIRAIVADNDELPSAREATQRTAAELGLDCLYVHAPARNISIARNACLDAATAPLLAFIDDDETAPDTWLMTLLSAWRISGAPVIFGPVKAIYSAGPPWLRAADLHSIAPVVRSDGLIETGYSSNVFIARVALVDQLRSCRFDPSLGRSGGEDTFFFHCLYLRGARLEFCPGAVVNELVSPNRARLRWLLTRSFRSGQTHGRVLIYAGRNRAAMIVLAAGKFVYCIVGACLRIASPPGWRKSLVRATLHVGVIAKILGLRDLQLY